ncbi:hypothetical protein VNI00_014519 [Paramarasmius palmivorus]|uniref:WD40 repeat-like protein n=1 Tax=Paramarasmius palmivorus TaxID=297713 RepID=A0AAW0BS01_9AGAR
MFARPYKLVSTFSGPQNAILSLSFSTDGNFLAATGLDGITIWDLRTMTQTPIPERYLSPEASEDMVSVSTWAFFERTSRHVLFFGCLLGDIIAWHWNDQKRVFEYFARATPNTAKKQILSMDLHTQKIVSKRSAHLAVSCQDRSVAVWKLSSVGEFSPVFAIKLDIIPKTVRFDNARNLHVFAYMGGEVVCLDRSGAIASNRSTDIERMGSVAFERSTERIIVSTGKDLRILSMDTLKHHNTLANSAPSVVLYPRQVTFAENNTKAVGGTDSGHAVLYDLKDGSIMQRLDYPQGGLVQTVAVHSLSAFGTSSLVPISEQATQTTTLVPISEQSHYSSITPRTPVPDIRTVAVSECASDAGPGIRTVAISEYASEAGPDIRTVANSAYSSTAVVNVVRADDGQQTGSATSMKSETHPLLLINQDGAVAL